MIKVEKISKKFGDVQALDSVSVSIKKGEVVCLVGPSGSGKSTLLRAIKGLEKADSGTILIDDEKLDVSNVAQQKKMGFVFQHFNLFPHLTVLENILLAPIEVLKIDKDKAMETALKYLSLVGLLDKKDSYPSKLSGGQKQRVAIARSLTLEPEVMLFDEPTSALDPEMVCEVLQVMQDLAEAGMSMVVVTHEMGFARKIASRVLFLENGQVVEDTEPEEFFRSPQTDRAQLFLDKMTFLQ